MKRLLPFFAILFAVCLMACHNKITAPEDAPKEALLNALEALNSGDYDTYMSHVDYGVEMDTVRLLVMRNALQQHIGWRTERKSSVASIDIVDADMEGDSICKVFYRYTYADGTDEVAVQKMVRRGEEWMLKARN
ncbi:MAG: DUF4878 domain-containing protein [Prevotellaceae bacterium]|nr:DUF4878 domain-containing protein [Prevotellaceae bacterium]